MSSRILHKILPGVIYCAAIAALVSILIIHGGWLLAPWQNKTDTWQPDPDAALISAVLAGPGFALRRGENVLWQSEPAWRVQDFVTGDINHDGTDELLLLVWRRGNYGPSRPFWVTGSNTDHYTQHLFIYAWNEEKETVAPIWMSSRLAPEIKQFSMNADGDLNILTRAGEDTLWGWRSWGIERLDAPVL